MKYVNLMKLLSVLLCAVMLFTACSNPKENAETDTTDTTVGTEETTPQKPTVREPVDPVLENFFVISEDSKTVTLGEATRLDGKYYDGTEDGILTVFRNSDIDFLNVRTDVYTVYNASTEKTVLTIEHSYTRGDYNDFDWDDIYINSDEYDEDNLPKFPESVMEVHPVALAYCNSLYLIEVRRATITPIDEKVVEENEGDLYTVETVYEYYDMNGQLLAKCSDAQSVDGTVYLFDQTGTTAIVIFEGNIVSIDMKTGAALGIVNADNEVIRLGFDDETELYGYCFGYQEGFKNYVSYVEVYSKADGSRVLRYYPEAADRNAIGVLENGNLLVQYYNVVEQNSGVPYDFEIPGYGRSTLYAMDTYVVDVDTGRATEIECEYVINLFWHRNEFLEILAAEKCDVTITENCPNVAIASKIVDKKIDTQRGQKVVVFNNDGSVMFEKEKLIPEQNVGVAGSIFGFSVLSNGDYLVNLVDVTDYQYAIVTKDGTVRSYLKADDVTGKAPLIAGEYVVLPNGVYNFDMKLVFDFEEEYTREVVIGNRILVSKEVENEETGDLERLFFELKKDDAGEWVISEALFDSEIMEVAECTKDYFILKNTTTGKYTLYNANLAHVLTTADTMKVMVCDGTYLVKTDLVFMGENVQIYYAIGQ